MMHQGHTLASAEWHEPLLVASLDVTAALDEMRPTGGWGWLPQRAVGPPFLSRHCWATGCGAILREHLGPVAAEPVPLGAGCRQGSPNQLLADPLDGVLSRWRGRDPDVIRAPESEGVALVWADEVFVLATSWVELAVRVAEVSQAVRDLGLIVSDSSLDVLANGSMGEGTWPSRNPGSWPEAPITAYSLDLEDNHGNMPRRRA